METRRRRGGGEGGGTGGLGGRFRGDFHGYRGQGVEFAWEKKFRGLFAEPTQFATGQLPRHELIAYAREGRPDPLLRQLFGGRVVSMPWPQPLRKLPLHDYVFDGVDFRDQPNLYFSMQGSPSYLVKLMGPREFIGGDLFWNCNIVFSFEVYRLCDAPIADVAKAFRFIARSNFYDRMEEKLYSSDLLLFNIKPSDGFGMMAIAADYELIEVP